MCLRSVGIICEYNPFHLGHAAQFQIIRNMLEQDTAIVCLMSGDYVQRGRPAIIDKFARAEAAICCGADLVLELPITASLSSAEGFAAAGVDILSRICTDLCFGTESMDVHQLMSAAQGLLSPQFPVYLKEALAAGVSFPTARQQSLKKLGIPSSDISRPNNILALEYCKAILQQNSSLTPIPIHRPGNYHDMVVNQSNPSATAVRALMESHGNWIDYVPVPARRCFQNQPLHTLKAGERAVLATLRSMDDPAFMLLPYGSEGLWRKLMHASRSCSSLDEIANAVKSKRYTRTRIDRMIMCAYLGISQQQLAAEVPYVRILAFNSTGRCILNKCRKDIFTKNAGEKDESGYFRLEARCADLYSLFSVGKTDAAGRLLRQRVLFLNGDYPK